MATLKKLQKALRFTFLYSEEFQANPLPHKVFSHALTHVGKALGRLFGLSDDIDHSGKIPDSDAGRAALRADYGKYLADIVICTLRAAEEFPGGPIDLDAEVLKRATEKNMVAEGDAL